MPRPTPPARERPRHLLEVVEQNSSSRSPTCTASSTFAPNVCATVSSTSPVSRSAPDHPEDTGLERRHELGGDLDRQPRLSRPTRPGQGQKPRPVPHQRQHLRDLPLAADEARRGPRQVGVRDRLQRRKSAVAELEEHDRLVEILQAVLPELAHDLVHLLACLLRQKDLPAVTRTHHPAARWTSLPTYLGGSSSGVPVCRPIRTRTRPSASAACASRAAAAPATGLGMDRQSPRVSHLPAGCAAEACSNAIFVTFHLGS